jgi:glycosyltransferase involved in cell wall biosynthesis
MSERWENPIGVVVIGRNEGELLKRSLNSVVGKSRAVIYVDSGSTDGSVAVARTMGVEVVELSPDVPFTAPRARNVGIAHLRRMLPKVRFVQVVDGDSEMVDGWLRVALRHMQTHSRAAVICGRTRERYPEASVYNQLCDMEWARLVGETHHCGGNAFIRLEAFDTVDGYHGDMIAGEDPEMY